MIADLTRVLTVRERKVVHLRFEHDLTQAEIGEHIGVSQMQVSRILRQAIGRLRSYAMAQARATGSAGGARAANHMTPSLGDGNDDAPSSAAPR